jgi:maltooligosyltrehalose synthase
MLMLKWPIETGGLAIIFDVGPISLVLKINSYWFYDIIKTKKSSKFSNFVN